MEHRGFKVTTVDGKEYRGRKLGLEYSHLRVFRSENQWDDVPSEEVARIEVRQGGRFFHHVANSAVFPVAMGMLFWGAESGHAPPVCATIFTAFFSPEWAYTAATAPFYLAADGIAFLIPPKVFEIIH